MAVIGCADGGGHFAARVGGWDGDVGEGRGEGERFAGADSTAITDGDYGFDGDGADVGEGYSGEAGGGVPGGFCESAGWSDGSSGGVKDAF